MPIASMTGFARAEGADAADLHPGLHWAWEVKSVNGRNLDVRCRLPPGFEALESPARAALAERFKRGNFALTLTLARGGEPPRARINRELLDQLIALAGDLGGRTERPRLDSLLGVRGVVEVVEEAEPTEEQRAVRLTRMNETLARALAALDAMRHEEGARLAALVGQHLDAIEALRQRAAATAAAQPAALKARLKAQLDALLEASPALPEERLAQEAALLVTKADVREELDRLAAHVAAARKLLAEGGAVGRKFDFLCQEFNREANTLCSKSADVELTAIGLELKAAIDQLREQVQNIE
ncbi:MAG TPA: YicC/YloC family endoribonuclease [Candidatus Acidoferrum sp.]|nr:YicC/YloC family endoribonuclease [Candidatus Acidoferrum sp.]